MKKLFFSLQFILSYLVIIAQTNTFDTTSGKLSEVVKLTEIVFSASRFEQKLSEIPHQMEIIKSKQIEFYNPQTSADMISNTGKVFVQKSQMGGGSPVLRGFEANKVLMVIDGIRMNNAIYRGGHLQDIVTLDNGILDRTEVIFGPSSVMYGSDALGGVIHFYTKKPRLKDSTYNGFSINAMTRYSTANVEKTGHVDFNIGLKRLAILSSITFSDFSDLRAGYQRSPYDTAFGKRYHYAERINGKDTMIANSDFDIQKQSGYSQMDFMIKMLYRKSERVQHIYCTQYSTSSNIPRYDRLTEYAAGKLRFAEWNYGPQMRGMGYYKLILSKNTKLFDRANFTVASQGIYQERISRRFNNNNRKTQLENVAILTLNSDLEKSLSETTVFRYGLEATKNSVRSTANNYNLSTYSLSPADTRYPNGGSSTASIAVYLTHTYKKGRITLNDGIRYSYNTLSAKFTDTTFFAFPYKEAKQKNGALTASIGSIFSVTKDFNISAVISSGYRVPNIDDLAKVFENSASGKIAIPNPNLKPENSVNGELTLSKVWNEKYKIEITGYYSKLFNAIVVKNFQFNNQDSIIYDGVKSQVVASQNADQAYIYGNNAGFYADFDEHFSFKSTINYTYGRYLDKANDTIVPLDHIPPLHGMTGIMYRYKNFDTEFYVLYNGWKRLKNYSPSGEDNLQYATAVGMPSWVTFNVKASYRIRNHFIINAGIENITDLHYRYFASGISAPGRNFIISLRYKY